MQEGKVPANNRELAKKKDYIGTPSVREAGNEFTLDRSN